MLKRDVVSKQWLEAFCKDLQRQLEEAEETIHRIDDTYECSVCGKEFLIHKPGSNAIHGAVFSPLEFEPPIWKGKVIDAVCSKCLKKAFDEYEEQKNI